MLNHECSFAETNEEAMLAQALAMSAGGNVGDSAPATGGDDVSMMTEEEQIAFALRLSMQPAAGATAF